jgi:hypothetical protein
MSVFVLTPETVWNPGALELRTAPRKIFEYIPLLPRRDVTWRLLARVIFENQFLRFMTALTPFVVAMFVWPQSALPISQAPIPMLIAIGFVEMRLLRVPKHKRDAVTTEDEAARALDRLAFRGRRVLSRIAASRGVETGTLFLVVEQSEIARVAPLTVVSVQSDSGRDRMVRLSAEEREIIRADLFDAEFTERDLHRANLRENVHMRSVSFDARGVSAHARLAAFLDRTGPGDAPADTAQESEKQESAKPESAKPA